MSAKPHNNTYFRVAIRYPDDSAACVGPSYSREEDAILNARERGRELEGQASTCVVCFPVVGTAHQCWPN